MKIELPIFYHTTETAKKADLEIKYSIKEDEIRLVAFYIINAVEKWEDENTGDWYSVIITGGEKYVCSLKYDEVVNMIDSVMVEDMQLNIR